MASHTITYQMRSILYSQEEPLNIKVGAKLGTFTGTPTINVMVQQTLPVAAIPPDVNVSDVAYSGPTAGPDGWQLWTITGYTNSGPFPGGVNALIVDYTITLTFDDQGESEAAVQFETAWSYPAADFANPVQFPDPISYPEEFSGTPTIATVGGYDYPDQGDFTFTSSLIAVGPPPPAGGKRPPREGNELEVMVELDDFSGVSGTATWGQTVVLISLFMTSR